MRFRGMLCLSLLLFSLHSFAAEESEKFPKQIRVAGKNLILNGVGTRTATFLKVKVYEAGLYLPKKSQNAQEIINSPELKRVDMEFLRHVSAKDIQNAWTESFRKNCEPNCSSIEESVKQL